MIEKLFEIQEILLNQFKQENFYYSRDLLSHIGLNNKITGIVGAPGVGKTTFLLKQTLLANEERQRALYLSADHLFFDMRLLDLVDTLYKETEVRLLCIDEIHKYPNWAQEMKNIVDSYPGFQLLFSGSSAIDIIQSKYDLSRRVTLHPLHGFSFREYLEFIYRLKIPKITFQELISSHSSIVKELSLPQILLYFKEYLTYGYYPFVHGLGKNTAHQVEIFQTIENITKKTIYEDIAVLHNLKTSSLLVLEKLYQYILQASPGEISVFKLANALQKNFESVTEYIELLRSAGLIRCLFPDKTGKAFLRNPTKMYPENTNMIYAHFIPQLQDMTQGKIRETFAVSQLQNAGETVYYSEIGDFKVRDYFLEIGGKNKTAQQLQKQDNGYVFADGIITGFKNTIPLYLLGFLY